MKKKPWRYFFVYVCSFGWDVIAWVINLIMWALWGTNLEWVEGIWFHFKPNSWPTRTWYRKKIDGKFVMNPPELWEKFGKWITWGGTSFGHAGFIGPGRGGGDGVDTPVEKHEHVHTEQAEVAMMFSFVMNVSFIVMDLVRGVGPNWWFHMVMWCLGWVLFYACGALVAWLRGEHAYKGNTNEESAYSQTDEKYHELLWAVEAAVDGESRHETALRYIMERENSRVSGTAKNESQTEE